jgi:hypothetical protein
MMGEADCQTRQWPGERNQGVRTSRDERGVPCSRPGVLTCWLPLGEALAALAWALVGLWCLVGVAVAG